MDDTENGSSRKLRPRRSSVLSDISNKIAGGLANVAGKVTKKRKLSGANEVQTTSVEAAEAGAPGSSTDNPVLGSKGSAKSSPTESLGSSKSSQALLAEDEIVINMSDPNKIRRTFPLRMKGQDPSQCLDILDSMYELYYQNEAQYAATPYMHTQDDLNNKMRSILVDWLVEVHHKFKLFPSTLWLCVNIIDRFLSKVQIKRARLQLVGISAFFIACKFEEVYPPEAKEFVQITDNAYSRKEMLAMESDILGALEYHILVPTGYNFLTRYLNCIRASDNIRMLANYYAERNLQEPHSLEVRPRVFAAAAVYAALVQQSQRYSNKLKSEGVWNRLLREESNLTEAELIPCARNIIKQVREEPVTTSKRKLIAAKKKYQTERYQNVAQLDLPEI